MKRTGFKKSKKPLKKKTWAIKASKKTEEWKNVRKDILDRMTLAGITECELGIVDNCTPNMFLALAHSKPRRLISGDEIYEVVLACTACHEFIDNRISKEDCYNIVRNAILNRKTQI